MVTLPSDLVSLKSFSKNDHHHGKITPPYNNPQNQPSPITLLHVLLPAPFYHITQFNCDGGFISVEAAL